jgi:hypothetical protein
METQAITDTPAHNPRSSRRVKKGRRACTFHLPEVLYLHLGRLALERSTNRSGGSLTYADLLRDAAAEFCARNPLGSPSSSPARELEPTPIEQLAERDHMGNWPDKRSTAYTHLEVGARQNGIGVVDQGTGPALSACGVAHVPERLTMHASNTDCPKCLAIVESNAAVMAAGEPQSKRRAQAKRSSKAPAKPAKKAGRR